jgi:ribonuclease E
VGDVTSIRGKDIGVSEQTMLVNASAGDECRIAIVEGDRLEELYTERASVQSHVGNVYLGRVVNVEAAIQAAFVDFSIGRNGFLHVSDLHPMHFPGESKDSTEKVGKKTPRRNRPPMQQSLKKGREILVQVLKDGIGTKGPTLTSYVSIPGRYLVMMPYMENLGVSRRVEDDDQRREMRKVLDSLDTPPGFGFILRTAGFGVTKTELKRDLAYLLRLWKDMEKRRKRAGGKPIELYSESDLLIRTVRDVLTKDIGRIIVDDVSALQRIDRFLRVVAPRSGPQVALYDLHTPLFHAYGIEAQIEEIRTPTVPLPSGGSLVIEETEALVAIDVNSGRSRDSRDAETTAFKTNMEAVEEISRQLRLRDLGGLVINDLIDMRSRSHQQQVESKFKDCLKRDRAKTKTLRTSQFGIIEMTRQRMRGGLRRASETDCPHCSGTGSVKRPEAVALDAVRQLVTLFEHDVVQRVEIVVAPRVASELLTVQRTNMTLAEQRTGKKIEVRVSEQIAPGRVDYYAYDDRGADINLERLPAPQPPTELRVLKREEIDELEADDDKLIADPESEEKQRLAESLESGDVSVEGEKSGKRKRRRRGRRRKSKNGEEAAEEAREPASDTKDEETPAVEEDEEGGKKKKRRRRRRRRKSTAESDAATDEGATDDEVASEAVDDAEEDRGDDTTEPDDADAGTTAPKTKKKRRRGKKKTTDATDAKMDAAAEGDDAADATDADRAKSHRRERTKKSFVRGKTKPAEATDPAGDTPPASEADDEALKASDEDAIAAPTRKKVKKTSKKKVAEKKTNVSKKKATKTASSKEPADTKTAAEADDEASGPAVKKKRTVRKRKKTTSRTEQADASASPAEPAPEPKPKPRPLMRGVKRKRSSVLSPGTRRDDDR